MAVTYRATLHGNLLEWTGPAPHSKESIPVYVTVLREEEVSNTNGQKMADALTQLANRGGLKTISDPKEWQRQQRQERTLPGRE